MYETIISQLKNIEAKEQVRILYACESGSRAWGFASTNSDYDVRFVYVHTPDWYLSIDDRRDVIEVPINDSLDISGWDIRKALRLLRKSNPPLLEWLRSPIVYLEQFSTAQRIRELSAEYFSPRNCLCHYLNMAEGNYREYLKGEQVRLKKYFYVLRPLLACRWIQAENTAPPMEFETLLSTQVSDRWLIQAINDLLERKRAGEELNVEPRVDALNDFIEAEIERFNTYVRTIKRPEVPNTEVLDELFRDTLEEVWNNAGK